MQIVLILIYIRAYVQDDPVDELEGINCVPNVKQEHKVTAGISNSFGFGGHNSVVCFAPFVE